MIHFDRISDRLFVGTCLRSEPDLQLLRRVGVTGVLSLQTDRDLRHWKIELRQLERHSLMLDLVLYRVPIADLDPEDLRRRLPLAVDTLARLLGIGHRVYLHCTAGQERSPAVAVGYLAWSEGWGLQRALDHVRDSRHCNPNERILRELDAQRSLYEAAC